jgi:dGTPase
VLDHLERLNLTHEVRNGIGGHSKGRSDLTAFDGQPTSTLEAAVVRISDRIAYMNHDLDDAVRSGIIAAIPERFTRIGTSHSRRIGAMVEVVALSPPMLALMNDLKEWLFENVYLKYPVLYPDVAKAKALVADLFFHFAEPGHLPAGFDGVQGAIDYVAGMTDRYAMNTYAMLRLPSGWRANGSAGW